tara:strand:- start:100 stop:294 length:195 start_codon:yes stop_codon:yes gene_type:complete
MDIDYGTASCTKWTAKMTASTYINRHLRRKMIKFTKDLIVIVPETAPESHSPALIALNKPNEIG